ncbi:MAG: tyrosine-type recombinase/integrase [Proteobacteria bacterium]|nr:tyrosine-type recombinase/integrase [Pseudomonadota bacterium]
MAGQLNKLKQKELDAAKSKERAYSMSDGGGLVVLVQPSGAKWWRFRYRHNGIPNMISLGTYPDTDLKTARDKRAVARMLLAKNIDPAAKRLAEKEAQADSFLAVAEEYMSKSNSHTSTIETMRRRFTLYIYPRLGKRPIADIDSPELLRALRRVEARGTFETAQRIRTACGQVFRYAIATGRAATDPAESLRGTLTMVKPKHYATMTKPKEIGPLLRAIDACDGHTTVVAALKMAPLVFVRPGELRGADWEEIDLEAAQWNIPADRMKSGRPHIVPLSSQAVAILDDLHPLTGPKGYVFPSVRSMRRPLSENTLNAALRRIGYTKDQITTHGFRSMASTLLHEQGYPSLHIERQLAHVEGNKVKASYNHAEYLPQRREMMQHWADYLDGLKKTNAIDATKLGQS